MPLATLSFMLYLCPALKKLPSIFLAFAVLANSFACTILVVQYQAQKDFIAKTLCENKNKPSKGCQGKCYLKKQLKKAEEAEKNLPSTLKEKMEVAYTIQETFQFAFFQETIAPEFNDLYSFPISEKPIFSDPHPPRA